MSDDHAMMVDEEPADPSRRRFLTRLSLWLSGVIGLVLGVPVIGYLLSPLLRAPEAQWVTIAPISDFEIDETVLFSFEDRSPIPWAGLTAQTAIYVRRTAPREFVVFSVNCTHLGCPVNWLPTAQLFVCPCHGGVFYRDGTVAAGPPPRELYEYENRVENDRLLVKTRPLPPAEPGLISQTGRSRSGG